MQAFSCDSTLLAVALNLANDQQSLYVMRLGDGTSQTLSLATVQHPPSGQAPQLLWTSYQGTAMLACVSSQGDQGPRVHGRAQLEDVGCTVLVLSGVNLPKAGAALWSPDGTALAVIHEDRALKSWRLYTCRSADQQLTAAHKSGRTTLTRRGAADVQVWFSPDSRLLLCVGPSVAWPRAAAFVSAGSGEVMSDNHYYFLGNPGEAQHLVCPTAIAWSSRGLVAMHVRAGMHSGTIALCTVTGTPPRLQLQHRLQTSCKVSELCFENSGSWLAFVSHGDVFLSYQSFGVSNTVQAATGRKLTAAHLLETFRGIKHLDSCEPPCSCPAVRLVWGPSGCSLTISGPRPVGASLMPVHVIRFAVPGQGLRAVVSNQSFWAGQQVEAGWVYNLVLAMHELFMLYLVVVTFQVLVTALVIAYFLTVLAYTMRFLRTRGH